jgi:pantoate--beta-alanine ligase
VSGPVRVTQGLVLRSQRGFRNARVQHRFSLADLVLATVCFAILFGVLKTSQVHWTAALTVCVFVTAVGLAQTVVRDAEIGRMASMVIGSIVFLAIFLVQVVMEGMPANRMDASVLPIVLACTIAGSLAGYFSGSLMAGIFVISHMMEHRFGRASGSDPEDRRQVSTLVVRTIDEVRAVVRQAREQSRHIGLVPTMGALHDGHMSLIRCAQSENDFTIVTIFVNPTQFGPHDDLARYPRPFQQDVERCRQAVVDLVFAPDASTIYPAGFVTYVEVEGMSTRLEGECRPGHFRGVATVVLKLFNIVQPDRAYFGQKDAQQARVIQQMVHDLNVPVTVQICPTVREPDGLAMSSRNQYLQPSDREQALALSRALLAAKALIDGGERDANSVRHKMRVVLESALGTPPDYAELVDPTTFEPVTQVNGPVLAVIAARVGSTRLIDNLRIEFHAPNSH